jgi:hypothetical protein
MQEGHLRRVTAPGARFQWATKPARSLWHQPNLSTECFLEKPRVPSVTRESLRWRSLNFSARLLCGLREQRQHLRRGLIANGATPQLRSLV